MQRRYRYRIEPTPAQQQMLRRVFGCCRVVFNDALRARDKAYQAGIKLSDSEIQRRVITQAKATVGGAGWPRFRVWRWCSRSTTPVVRGATSSTHAQASGAALRLVGHA